MSIGIMDYISPIKWVKHAKEFACIVNDVKCGSEKIVNNLNANGIKIDEFKARKQQSLQHNH